MAGVYVHIPFCARRCAYCDFYSLTDHRQADALMSSIVAEARARRGELPVSGAIKTLYVGGGTPSQLSLGQIERLIGGLASVLPLDGLDEFTFEVNPDDVTLDLIRTLVRVGVNRVSMGVQSFVDSELRFIGRRHDAAAAVMAVDVIRRAGINNISVDLIYGIPGQTMQSWRETVDAAIALQVQHISAYNLSYEPGTRLWRMREQGLVHELPDELCVAMYTHLVTCLKEAGFEHYEISNFSLPGQHSRHNSAYWDGTPYLGLGPAAHSFDGVTRRYNPADLTKYLSQIAEHGIAYSEENLLPREQYDELVMLALRTARGLDTSDVHHRFGQDMYDYLMRQAQPHILSGRLTAHEGRLRLAPDAVMMSDAIIRDLFYEF